MFFQRSFSTTLLILNILCIQDSAYALHESCSKYFEGFSLPEKYNPNAPPDVQELTIKNKIIVREILKVNLNS